MACTTANRLLFLINFLDVQVCFRGFLEITEPHVFLIKNFILAINKKAFSLESYVVCFVSVYTIYCCLTCRVGISTIGISLVFWETELDTSLSSSICQPSSVCRYRARGLSLFRGNKVKIVIELDDLSSSVTYRARFFKRRKKEKKWKLKQ